MQGLYKLVLVGTKEQLSDFLKKVNDTDPDSVFNEYAVEEGTGLRTVKGYGLQKFLDRYKLLIENTGSGNISGMDEMVTEIGKIAPELEIMLLTQYLDYSDDYTWTIFYKPAGETDPSETAGILYNGTINGSLSFGEFLNYKSMGDTVLTLDIDRETFKEYFDAYNEYSEFTYEEMEPLLDAMNDPERTDFSEFEDTLDMVLVEDVINGYLEERDGKCNTPYAADGNGVPAIEYIARLFAGSWGINFGVSYRFHPETFDDRFAGKSFVITGEPDDYGKDGAKEIIEAFGGVVRGAVSGKTDYLLVGEYAGEKKLEKARELGTPIITADDLEQMIS